MIQSSFAAAVVVLALVVSPTLFVEVRTGGEARETLQVRLEQADQAFRNRLYEEATARYEGVADDALRQDETSIGAEACAMRARCYLVSGEAEQGRPWLERAADLADSSMPLAWSRYLGVRGRFEWEDGDTEKATATFLRMFEYCEEHGLFDRAVDAAHMIATTGNPEQKYEWALKGIEIAEKGGMKGWLGTLWNNLGWDYVDAGRYDDAGRAFEKAREYHYRGTAELPKLIADYSVAHVMRLQGQLEEARTAMLAVFDWAGRLLDSGNPDALEWVGFSRWELGEIAIAEGDRSTGVAMLKEALRELEAAGMPDWDPGDWDKRNARVQELGSR